jgi:hypothetical protein
MNVNVIFVSGPGLLEGTVGARGCKDQIKSVRDC